MTTEVPQHASAVIIGGGITGASVAYHLARQGWSDVVLLERASFACGTTWHAAGLIGTLRATESHARLAAYSMGLLQELEEETGQSTGFRQVGSLSIAHSKDRFEELRRVASMNNAFGVTRVDTVTVDEISNLFPLINSKELLGGTFVAHDGKSSPIDITMAFVKGARGRGARCLEGVSVESVLNANGRVRGVRTTAGIIKSDFVVNCAGLWARALGKLSGVNIPLHACEHYYAVTEKHPDIHPDLPVLRDHDKCAYYREDTGALLVGAFEPNAVPWGQNGIPGDFSFDELPGHMEEQLMPVLEDAMQRVPLLAKLGWRKFFCGPESFTPDDQFHIGEAPELRGYFLACGLNSVGIQSSGGLGKACAEWMDRGAPSMDLWSNDIRRVYPFMGTQAFIEERVSETLGLLYARHYPQRQYQTGRNVRHSPIHERLRDAGACFGQVAGWERPDWFAVDGMEAVYDYSFGKARWFKPWRQEHLAARNALTLFDQSSFSKYLVEGRDAVAVLQRICTADIDVEPGRVVYTHWLNERGGIEADLTVARLTENRLWIVSGAAVTGRDLDWLARNTPDDARVTVVDITSAWAVFGVMGPRSRALLEPLMRTDLSAAAFPFGTSKEAEIGYAPVRATRVSYVGELGWEIYVSVDMARHVYDVLMQAGAAYGIRNAGMHALDSCRMEKKFVHFGHDVGDEDTPLEAGLGFVCAMDKAIAFIGHEAIAKQREGGAHRRKRLVQFVLEDSEPMLYQHEPIVGDGHIKGFLTSGSFGHTLGASVGLGYVYHEEAVSADFLNNTTWQIEIGGERFAAKASLRARYDPRGEKMRG
ncbi:MAG: FAD-dependent oxidoreductase [Gammaproteobacteria bacterium]|nr:FAD-dependent oxidoreductase [Gammaproteobacteria bacterium]